MDNNSSNLKRIIDDNSNSSIKLDDGEFNELFFRVWHNVVLRNQILKHRHLLNEYNWVKIKSHQELENHQFRDYITELVFQPSTPIRIELLQSLSSLTRLELLGFNQPLLPGMIPHSVNQLVLVSFNHPLTKDCIPSSVKELYLTNYNQQLLPNDQRAIPDSVTILELYSYNQALVANSLPSSITQLGLESFNQPLLRGSIPSSVITLSLSGYNLPLSKYSIPPSVTTLQLYNNQSLENLPPSVTDLSLDVYNPLEGSTIPESIAKLELFNEPKGRIKTGTLPSSIQLVIINYQIYKIGEDFQDAIYFGYTPIVHLEDISEDSSEDNSYDNSEDNSEDSIEDNSD